MEIEGDGILSPTESWELLKTTTIGRLVLSLDALPVLLPVQYYVDGNELAICLGHHEIPQQSVNNVIVAFGADAIDPDRRGGWAVQVQGTVEAPHQLGTRTDCGQPAAGQIIQLAPEIIRGHRVQLCPFLSSPTGDPEGRSE